MRAVVREADGRWLLTKLANGAVYPGCNTITSKAIELEARYRWNARLVF